MAIVEPLLMSITRITTLKEEAVLSNATGFFLERDSSLFLITNRHVFMDEPTGHAPDACSLEIHTAADNLAEAVPVRFPLYQDGTALWRESTDAAGLIDIVALPIDRQALPPTAVFESFTPADIVVDPGTIEVGTALLITGFPLGFYDTLHHLPVARQATVASAFGLRFQGKGYFMTDARTHRGTSGAPVVTHAVDRADGRKWSLLGVHAARLDMSTRDLTQDEALGLNCAWYADALLVLTDPPPTPTPVQAPPANTQPAPSKPGKPKGSRSFFGIKTTAR